MTKPALSEAEVLNAMTAAMSAACLQAFRIGRQDMRRELGMEPEPWPEPDDDV